MPAQGAARAVHAAHAARTEDAPETNAPHVHAQLDENDEDIFGLRQMKALIGRIRERLGQGGYSLDMPRTAHDPLAPSPLCYGTAADGSREMLRLAAPRHGPSCIFVYPPEAFYVIHWREDRCFAALRSASACYGIHNWDTTWAPHALIPNSAYSSYLGPFLRPLPARGRKNGAQSLPCAVPSEVAAAHTL